MLVSGPSLSSSRALKLDDEWRDGQSECFRREEFLMGDCFTSKFTIYQTRLIICWLFEEDVEKTAEIIIDKTVSISGLPVIHGRP